MSKVSINEVRRYDCGLIRETIHKAFDEIGFDLTRLKGKRVAVKPNLLSASKPEQAIITHPEFFRAAARIIKDAGAFPVLIESPAIHSLSRVFRVSGYDRVIEEEGIEVDLEQTLMAISNESGRRYKHFEIMKSVADTDFIFNLPKFKTHGLTYITGAQKNLFGLIPGLAKTQWHLKANVREIFCEFLVDYFEAVSSLFREPKCILHLMDAITGMEGNGPGTGGKPREIGAVIVSEDAIAIDFLVSSLVGFDPRLVKTISISAEHGLGKKGFDKIEFDRSIFDRLKLEKFEPAPLPFNVKLEKIKWLNNLMKRLMVERPVPIEGTCTMCYQCRQICPAKAIDKGETVAIFNYDKCIRCFCCIEVCPEAAIRIEGNFLSRIFSPAKR
jgi:uncharacterized protein (DUF362 family)/NAD-dependent dihydropyrimidine dehydrogenase PreA subunit